MGLAKIVGGFDCRILNLTKISFCDKMESAKQTEYILPKVCIFILIKMHAHFCILSVVYRGLFGDDRAAFFVR